MTLDEFLGPYSFHAHPGFQVVQGEKPRENTVNPFISCGIPMKEWSPFRWIWPEMPDPRPVPHLDGIGPPDHEGRGFMGGEDPGLGAGG